ncbi:MAG: hypothetical protein R3F43_32110 [bacterium]
MILMDVIPLAPRRVYTTAEAFGAGSRRASRCSATGSPAGPPPGGALAVGVTAAAGATVLAAMLPYEGATTVAIGVAVLTLHSSLARGCRRPVAVVHVAIAGLMFASAALSDVPTTTTASGEATWKKRGEIDLIEMYQRANTVNDGPARLQQLGDLLPPARASTPRPGPPTPSPATSAPLQAEKTASFKDPARTPSATTIWPSATSRWSPGWTPSPGPAPRGGGGQGRRGQPGPGGLPGRRPRLLERGPPPRSAQRPGRRAVARAPAPRPPVKPVLFLSDLHFHGDHTPGGRALLDVLARAEWEAEAIYPSAMCSTSGLATALPYQACFPLLHRRAPLVGAGTEVHLFTGNHDLNMVIFRDIGLSSSTTARPRFASATRPSGWSTAT